MATILALPGFAKLLSTNDGEIVLAFDSLRFGRKDVVPKTLLALTDCPGPCPASAYVAHCMIRQFGADYHGWPSLAQVFVSRAKPPLSLVRNTAPWALTRT